MCSETALPHSGCAEKQRCGVCHLHGSGMSAAAAIKIIGGEAMAGRKIRRCEWAATPQAHICVAGMAARMCRLCAVWMPVAHAAGRRLAARPAAVMSSWLLAAALAVLLSFVPAVYAAPLTLADNTGHIVTLEQPATRIVGLYGTFNELLLALDLRTLLVGRTNADADIAGLESLPAVGTHMRPDPERIVGLKPDIVLLLTGRKEAAVQGENLRRLGMNVLEFRIASFEELFFVLRTLGEMTAHADRAAALEKQWRARLARVRAQLEGVRPARAFFEVRYPNLLGAGRGGIVQDIITLAGGENVVDSTEKLVRLNEEILFASDPDVYISQRGPMNTAAEPVAERAHYKALRAVREGRVLVVEEKRFSRPGPASVEAVEALARWLHPARYSMAAP